MDKTSNLVICEIGKNYITTKEPESEEVLLNKAKHLVDLAKEAGADLAKFQVHYRDEIHPFAKINSPHFDHDRYEWVKRNIMPVWWWFDLKEHCRKIGIEFLFTPMSRGAADMMDDGVGVERWKIGSGDILDFPLLDYIRDTGKHVILSSGMSSLEELKKSYKFLDRGQPITILHCVSMYPCPISSLNLATIPFLQKEFPNASIGFSDHSIGIEGSLMAASLGATIIEKHMTLDRGAWGPDHKVSLLPREMKELVGRIKSNELLEPITEALGTETKFLQKGEEVFRPSFRKGLYAANTIFKGDFIGRDDVMAMRPRIEGARLSEDFEDVIEKVADRDIKKYEIV